MISVTRVLAAPPERVFAYLAHLPNHWRLAESLQEVESTGELTAHVRLRGPLGISRTAVTEVVQVAASSRLRGRALVGGTLAHVAWDLEPVGGGTRVTLSTEIVRATPADAIVLALGGNWWLRRVYAEVLAQLGQVVA